MWEDGGGGHSAKGDSPAIILEELTGVELAAIPPGVAPLP